MIDGQRMTEREAYLSLKNISHTYILAQIGCGDFPRNFGWPFNPTQSVGQPSVGVQRQ
jgi:hypothetical protein